MLSHKDRLTRLRSILELLKSPAALVEISLTTCKYSKPLMRPFTLSKTYLTTAGKDKRLIKISESKYDIRDHAYMNSRAYLTIIDAGGAGSVEVPRLSNR